MFDQEIIAQHTGSHDGHQAARDAIFARAFATTYGKNGFDAAAATLAAWDAVESTYDIGVAS